MNNDRVKTLPPILVEYITSMFNNQTNNQHIRRNYRDSVDYIRSVCDEAVRKFDKESTVVNTGRRKVGIRSAHAE
jgi:hypothetical protein